jgi:hypothetical protein
MIFRGLERLLRRDEGSSAAEFAMVFPAFLALVFAVMHLGIVIYAVSCLHAAAQAAARCASVNIPIVASTTCTTTAKIQAYGAAKYIGPHVGQSFTYSTASCGNLVQASGTYRIPIMIAAISVPLTAQACYP